MVKDAEAHRSEDAAHRELINARNELDSVAYQVQRSLNENAEAVPEHERARAGPEGLVDEPCPDCAGTRLNPTSRLVSVHLVSRRHIDFRRVGSAVCPG